MEEITTTSRVYNGEGYDVQTVQVMMDGVHVHVQIMKCKITGKVVAPRVDVFALSSNNNELPPMFDLKVFTDTKMTKRTVKRSNYSVIKITKAVEQ